MKPVPPTPISLHRDRPHNVHLLPPRPTLPPRPVLFDQGDGTDVTLTELEARATLRFLESLSPYAGEQIAIHELCDTLRRKLRRTPHLPAMQPVMS